MNLTIIATRTGSNSVNVKFLGPGMRPGREICRHDTLYMTLQGYQQFMACLVLGQAGTTYQERLNLNLIEQDFDMDLAPVYEDA